MASFQYIKPTDEQVELMQVYRDRFTILYNEIETNIPNSRWKSLALTNLEQSAMWLNKWITENS